MSHHSSELSRRRFTQLIGLSAALAAAPAALAGTAAAASRTAADSATAPDGVAATYYRVLLDHTRWSETQWNAAAGHYTATDFGFAVVLGNAVLLTRGTYDAGAAGVDQETLRTRTLATLRHFAASNRLTGGTEWGKKLFFDTTFQSYFVLAARLLWDQLDTATQKNVETIAVEQARYTTSLGTADDPASGGWTPHGTTGGFQGDTKLEEMGVYAQSLAPGIAWAPDTADQGDWRAAFGRWSRNEAGLPAADLANPARVDGVPVSDNTAQNLYDTFIVENHESFGPHYQEELWRTSGRNSAHFITAGRPLPEVLTSQPNAGPLWDTLLMMMSDAGEPLMPMVEDREHLYGRDVIPLAFLAQVLGDRSAARAEVALAERLEAYQAYPPVHRMAKFSGEPKYEPEARAEIAISYLLHEWRARKGSPVRPLTERELFERASGAKDFGTGPGLLAHQSPGAWAATVTKPGFVKFAWQPAHDDWLFALSGHTPMFLPAATGKVTTRSTVTYSVVRDGFDGSASALALDTGYAGMTTLPSGAVVYATSGTGAGEGRIEVRNLTMPGIAGLTGSRTYTTAEGATTVPARDTGGTAPTGARTDELALERAEFRYIRMLGVTPAPTYGYSLYAFEVRDGADGTDLARTATATASSADTGKEAPLAIDGDPVSRWAVSRGDRTRADSSLTLDLGAPRQFDRVTLRWESAAGKAYAVQGSADGQSWTDLVRYPQPRLTSTGGWISVDGRAGLVVREGGHPIAVYDDTVVLADGAAAPLLVEGYPSGDGARTRAESARTAPTSGHGALRASTAEDHLSLFNLSGEPVTTTVGITQNTRAVRLYEGEQTVTATGTEFHATAGAVQAMLLPPRLTLSVTGGGRLPAGIRAEVTDARTVRLTGPSSRLTVTAPNGRTARVTLRSGRTKDVTLPGVTPHPLTDAALGRTTFPTTPLPAGMSDPAAAVDGDTRTSWTPGPGGRMVVDLGAVRPLTGARVEWTGGRVPSAGVEFSSDGRSYESAGTLSRRSTLTTAGSARYVALSVPQWRPGDARVVSFSLI
ncbi:discoidin domain-containing protein [Streptomyces beijiangensis]|uniref:Discoidin domain-containing protein n=1 Tax=Streptomyces beijiangensis TaxID=163361 RepID=A0A939FBV8_9ACTN|nr:discoidin domain-containing protein [Streptomyces beijiangensis]MBO0515728.1 discoidin domain-containing protein [Streptomyces beijiangensis]